MSETVPWAAGFPRGVISYVVWFYYPFAISFRGVEDAGLRGVLVSSESVRLTSRSEERYERIGLVLGAFVAVLMTVDPAGLAAWQARDFALAEATFRKALQRRPSDAMVRLWLARTLLEVNRNSEAMTEIERALNEPVSPEVHFEAGHILHDLALQRLTQLEAVAPQSPVTLELAGERAEWTGNLDEAVRNYRSASAREDGRPGIHYRIGNVLWRKREFDAAFSEIEKELAMNPRHGMANLRFAQILLQMEKTSESIAFFERALEAMPDSSEARREAGKAYRKTGRLSDARMQWEKVAQARPDDLQIHYLLGNLYRDLGEPALASAEFKKHRAVLERRQEHQDQ